MKVLACAVLAVASQVLGSPHARAGTEGVSSTFYGDGAGFHNINGGAEGSNTFIGYLAGYDTSSGLGNTFVGFSAGTYNQTGQNNTFVGEYAGENSTASGNTFLGSSSGQNTTAGDHNTFIGADAGAYNISGYYNTYTGWSAGQSNTAGQFNTALGTFAGNLNASGSFNTYLGAQAGQNNTGGSANIFIGNAAGYTETGSNKLYIDPCLDGNPCTTPLIYGEFDTGLLRIGGVTHVHTYGAVKSQMHFSKANTDTGGWLTSVLDNNFFVSSGARYDSGNWVQRSADGNAVMAGSGGQGYRIFTHTGTTVGNTFNNPILRLQIDYSGQFGINTAPVAGDEIHTSSGAHLTSGGVWTDASSREYKENVKPLTTEQALQAVAQLTPVTYNYKADGEEKHVGFIAEDVPELVATKDRRSLSPMDIVAALTKVVQEKSRLLDEQAKSIQELRAAVAAIQGGRKE